MENLLNKIAKYENVTLREWDAAREYNELLPADEQIDFPAMEYEQVSNN